MSAKEEILENMYRLFPNLTPDYVKQEMDKLDEEDTLNRKILNKIRSYEISMGDNISAGTVSCINTDNPNCTVTDGKPHSDAGFVQVGEPDLNIPKSTTYKTDGPIMMYNKEEKKLTPIRDYMTGATQSENVLHPPHYNTGKIEVIDFIEDQKLGFHLGNAIKYICRAGKKDPNKTKEDLDKAIWYINRYKENLK